MDARPQKPRLQGDFRTVIHAYHYSTGKEKSDGYWIRFYLRFHAMRRLFALLPREVNSVFR